ncbi:MAG: BolA/IbaG family iron-sulfur metabolism protein [Pseudomonadales bacterium]|mgnify:FL=1|jgi:BolA protein|nr:BolA/IbaG family iron-sulfur metabolism protein [Pseudomonadales bacterium]MBP9032329.1 BolA/IbaG family iron-sulfur metabolism protein [Pseudomonadales bacterium]
MRMQRTIEHKLAEGFTPQHLEVLNESHQHSVPPGSESHFKVVLVSAAFEGKRSVARHQQVYKVLAQELAGGVHALSLHTYTPAEWAERAAQAPDSPACMGGSKHDH